MSQDNVKVVRDQFAAVNERDFPRAMSHYAEDVVLVVDRSAFLESVTFKGRDAVGQWFAEMVQDIRGRLSLRHRRSAGSG